MEDLILETNENTITVEKFANGYLTVGTIDDYFTLTQPQTRELIAHLANCLKEVEGEQECDHPFASVMSKCNGEINHCLKCGEKF